MRRPVAVLAVLCTFLAFLACPATAQTSNRPPDEYGQLIRQSGAFESTGDALFGDEVNGYTGELRIRQVDVDLPGNDLLQMTVARTFKPRSNVTRRGLFGDWDLELPRLGGMFSSSKGWTLDAQGLPTSAAGQRCSRFEPPVSAMGSHSVMWESKEYWYGYFLRLPDADEEMILSPGAGMPMPADGATYRWLTPSGARLSCIALSTGGSGEGFRVRTPDGRVYTLDVMISQSDRALEKYLPEPEYSFSVLNRKQVWLVPSSVSDRFGNTVTYTWSGNRLLSLQASDGRRIELSYDTAPGIDRIVAASAHGRSWSYAYDAAGNLSTVTRPDGSQWSLTLGALSPVSELTMGGGCGDPGAAAEGDRSGSITAPAGATGSWTVRTVLHGRSQVPNQCMGLAPDGLYSLNPAEFWSESVISRSISGPGLPSGMQTSWSYGPANACYTSATYGSSGAVCSGASPTTKTVTRTLADGRTVQSTFGNRWQQTEGQLLERQIRAADTSVLRTESLSYWPAGTAGAFPATAGSALQTRGDGLKARQQQPLTARSVQQQAATFAWTANAFDGHARATSVTRASSGTTADRSRTDTTAYADHTGLWVLGQVGSISNGNTGLVLQNTTYNAQALPIEQFAFGKKQSTSAWNADGTLSSIADGIGNATAVSNWKRGIPQSIQFPATAEAPAGATQTATVNDLGEITQVTDENGYSHSYQYDPMGRLSRIDYPGGDSTAWTPTSITTAPVAGSEYGLPAGHWKRTESTGNRQSTTYFDGLWRPVVVEQYDAATPTTTRSIQVSRYDALGRKSFVANPIATLSSYADSLGGITTTYDALDRPTTQTQTSELGNLATSNIYQSGFKTQTTDPRGAITLTHYTAWDEPSTEMAARITLPEDRITDFSRDALGDVTALTRRNAAGTVSLTRSYVRNAHRELCKQIDPESGATVRDFDAAGNVSWQASGLNLPSTTNCDTASAYSSGRRMDLTWDARNRETARSYPDGMGNATTTYWPDGLVNTQTAYNGPSNTVPVITTHSFNKRRLPITETSSQPGWYGWSVQRGYDTAANPNSITYPNGLIVNYAPNALGQPTQVTASDGTTLASSILFYPNGALKQFNYGNGIAHTMTQNARQLPARSLDVGVIDENYVYDANANTVAINDPIAGTAGNRAMTYDLSDRLLTTSAAIFGGDGVHRNSYDALDNIKSWKLTGVKDYANYVYDARNLPTQINNTAGSALVTQSFDAQGNLSAKNGQGYQFDFGNRLRAVSGVEVSRYDAAGRRVTRWPSTGDGLMAMYTADNAFLYAENHRAAVRKRFSYVHLQGSLLATYENNIDTNANAWTYQHTDALDSPVATTNAAGAVTERTNYEPWGAAIGKPAMDHVGYTGHQMDGTTGLIYMQQRYYDPDTGQFTGVDPVYVDLSIGSNFNRRNYANNNSYKFRDPNGRQEFAVGGAVAGCAIAGPACPIGAGIGGATGLLIDAAKWGIVLYGSYRGIKYLTESSERDSKNSKVKGDNGGDVSDQSTAELPPPDDENKPASEKTGRDISRRVERDLGKDAKRKFHDMKEKGAADRTLKQLQQDARDLYIDHDKEIPKWLGKP
ncbi:RHS repeat domain-containing protein [Aquilutibacter rugosus]|uniref:RHS repeat domain-containing protein n=1 Tax=Aquilutibacter rugosus TaxID=3115820 RepID=UPI002F3E8FD6